MKKLKTITLVLVMSGLTGCATTNKDPLEGINRGVYKFNDVADRYTMQPVAKAYRAVAPSPVRIGISNFFSNLGMLTNVLNDLLQLKFSQAFTDAGRFVINSTFGLAGFVDVAGMDKIEKHNEDFGQTLGYWGVGSGPYLVLPILGPSSVRDAVGLAFDTATSDPVTYLHNTGQIRTHNQVRLVQLLDKRTQLLDATDLVDDASIDPYAFMRDAFLQRRASLVQDGLVPRELLQDEFEPAEEEAVKPSSQLQNNAKESSVVLLQSETPISDEEPTGQPPAVVEVHESVPNSSSQAPVSLGAEASTDLTPEAKAVVTSDPDKTEQATTEMAVELQSPVPVKSEPPATSSAEEVVIDRSVNVPTRNKEIVLNATEAEMLAALDQKLRLLQVLE